VTRCEPPNGTVSASYVVEAIGALTTAEPNPAETQARLAYVAGNGTPI
jgi:hypothetical protein